MDSPTSDDIPCGYVCTHAITGSVHPAHQAIYICETCHLPSPSNEEGGVGEGAFCICECCAEVCHADHNVEFVGVGPGTCDCSRLCCYDDGSGKSNDVCKLMGVSREEAIKLGFDEGIRKLNEPIPMKVPPICTLLPTSDVADMETEKPSDVHDEDRLAEWTAPQCIECNSSMGGYTIDSFTIPSLSSSPGSDQCHSLIRQAEALVEESRETFWVPIDDDESSVEDSDLCDLELLAREIYKRHLIAYNLNTRRLNEKRGIQDNLHPKHLGDSEQASQPGAEWWVQVKPAGSSKTPVDLHYDKDEALAEAFCIGSFPTLSTVTYLTGENDDIAVFKDDDLHKGGMDEAPTVVFPHTYHDDEDQPISSMLLSRPVRGKHIVFDGRLLHGASGHPALRLNGDNAAASMPKNNSDDSLLRVTFLVNIWRTGRPAGVHILPQDIRRKVQRATLPCRQSLFARLLEFKKRSIQQYSAPSKLSLAFSAENPMDTHITLPFVSKGATWILNDDDSEVVSDNVKSDQTDKNVREAALEAASVDIDDNDDYDKNEEEEEEEEEEDDDELFLSLPRFAAEEYLIDRSDTAMFLFEPGNEARLVRRAV